MMFFSSVSRQGGRGAATRRETPDVIFATRYGNRCDFNYYAAHRRVTDAPPPPSTSSSGLHHSTSVPRLHAKKADSPAGETQLLAAAEESLCSTGSHTCSSPENISPSTDLRPATSPRSPPLDSCLSTFYLSPFEARRH